MTLLCIIIAVVLIVYHDKRNKKTNTDHSNTGQVHPSTNALQLQEVASNSIAINSKSSDSQDEISPIVLRYASEGIMTSKKNNHQEIARRNLMILLVKITMTNIFRLFSHKNQSHSYGFHQECIP